MRYLTNNFILRATLLIALVFGLIACGGGGGGDTAGVANVSGGSVVFGGSVGDGPVTGASVRVFGEDGAWLGTIVSDSKANYRANITPTARDYPLLLVVNDGIDLVTGKKPDFQMESVMLRPTERVVNINPFSTLITLVAQRLTGGLTASNISRAKSMVMSKFSFGLSRSAVADPISTSITRTNIAAMVKSSEAMGEVIRRTRDLIRSTGRQVSGDTVMRALAADMVDGHPDGLGNNGTDATITAVINVVRGQVLVEALSNNLRVGGVIATGVIDQAIKSIQPDVSAGQLTGGVRVTGNALQEVRIALAAVQVLDGSAQVANIVSAVNRIGVNSTAASVANILPASSTSSLNTAVNRVPNASNAQINAVNQTVFAQGDTGSISDSGSSAGSSTGSSTGSSSGPGSSSQANGSFSLRWTAPSKRSDGSPLSLAEISRYNIYYGTTRGNYNKKQGVSNGSATKTTVNNLASGTYYLVMTTVDGAGAESARSGEVTKNVP